MFVVGRLVKLRLQLQCSISGRFFHISSLHTPSGRSIVASMEFFQEKFSHLFSDDHRWPPTPPLATKSSTIKELLKEMNTYNTRNELEQIGPCIAGAIDGGLQPEYIMFYQWARFYADRGKPEGIIEAVKAADKAGIRVTPHFQTLLVKALSISRRSQYARYYVRDACYRQPDGTAPAIPTEPVWRTLIKALGEAGHPQKAQEAIRDMMHFRVLPRLETWNSLCNAYAERGKVDDIWEIIDEMKKRAIKPSAQTFGALLKACARSRNMDATLKALTAMKELGLRPTQPLWIMALNAGASVGNSLFAEVVFELAFDENSAPDQAWACLLKSYRLSGNLDSAKQLMKRIEKRGKVPHITLVSDYLLLLGSLGLAEDMIDSWHYWFGTGKLQPDAASYNIYIGHLLWHWNRLGKPVGSYFLETALEAFEEAWASQLLRPTERQLHSSREYNFHSFGVWVGQLLLIKVLEQTVLRGTPYPTMVIIVGQGLRKHAQSPMQVAFSRLFDSLGIATRQPLGNPGRFRLRAEELARCRAKDLHLENAVNHLIEPTMSPHRENIMTL